MAKYISCEDAQKIICGWCGVCQNPTLEDLEKCDDICPQFARIPAVDVRPVVTCEECDWHVDCGYHFCNKWCLPCPDNADFYCAYGERPTMGLV